MIEDREMIICLHGWLSTKARWRLLGEILHEDFDFRPIDLPGLHIDMFQGFLPKDITEIVELTFNTIEDLSPSGPVFLMGHSTGGFLALEIALKYPSFVKSLIFESLPLDLPFLTKLLTLPRLGSFLFNLFRKTRPIMVKFKKMRNPWNLMEGSPQDLLLRIEPQTLLQYLEAYRWYSPAKVAQEIKKPVLLIYGSKDRFVKHYQARKLNGAFENSYIHFLPKASHSPSVWYPQETACLIKEFIEK